MSLQRPSEVDENFREILALGRSARQTVGFLPDSAFAERARQGTLLAYVDDQKVGGYVLYDLPRDEIRVVHLVVAPQYRGNGVARQLIDAVADEHPDRRGMLLHCRNDFPAHDVWGKLDFVPLGERPGKSFDGKPLTRWFRPFGQLDLFTLLEEQDTRQTAIIDSCVFFDLVAVRPKPPAQHLRADWLGEHVRLAVTDQLMIEIKDGTDPAERKRQRLAAEPFRLPSVPPKTWRPIYRELLDTHPDAPRGDRDDLRHVAHSIASQATWLITSDRTFINRYGKTAASLGGLGLLLPVEFVREIDEQARGERYRPVDLVGTAVTRREVDARSLQRLAEVFVQHAESETIRGLRSTIEHAAGRPDSTRLELIEVDGIPRGLICCEGLDGVLLVSLLRATAGRGETTIGRHLLGLLRDAALASGAEVVRVVDPTPSASVKRSFRDEGFASGPAGVVAHILTGSGTLRELQAKAEILGSPAAGDGFFGAQASNTTVAAAAAERWFAPYRVVGSEIPTFIVPIKHAWATELFDAGLSEGQLFSREWDLGLRRELVYYRNPANARGLKAPARLLWYVSGAGRPGAGTIRAASHLTGVTVERYERLFHRFQPLGAYDLEDVKRCADGKGRAMALRFSQTELLRRPVGLDHLRQLLAGDRKSRRVVLQSPLPISEHVFVSILEASSA